MKFPPIPYNEKERLKALYNYQVLGTQSEDEFDRLTELASIICDVPISQVTLVDENRLWFKSNYGIDISEVSRDLGFCGHVVAGNAMMQVEDATLDDRFYDNPFVTDGLSVRFYAGYPLTDPKGYNLGTLCVVDTKPKKLSDQQEKALELLAKQATKLICDQRKREELRNFEALFDLSNDLICIAGTDGFFKKINPAFEKVVGWDEKFLLQNSFLDLVHPDEREMTKAQLARLIAGETTINFVQRFRCKNGEYLYLQWVTSPEPITGNLFAVARNVTEEKLKEELLKISEDRFRSFFENSQGLMCTHDMDGNFLTVNSAGAHLLGYSVEDVLKLSLFDLVPAKHHPSLHGYLREIRDHGKSQGLMTTVHKNGSFRIWSYHNILIKNQYGQDYIVGNSIDISESHHMAKKLEKMQEMLIQTNQMARVGGWEVDYVKNKVYWSEVTKEILEVPSDYKPYINAGWVFYKEGESKQKLIKAHHLVKTEGTGYDLELQVTTAKGNDLWVRAIGNADFENGECKRLYGTFQDIDEKKRSELEVDKARKRLDDVLNAASEVSIIATDSEGMITVFNKGAEKLLGYAAEEVIGKFTPEIIHVKEEILSHGEELTKKYQTPIEGFRVFVHTAERENLDVREWTYKTKTGHLFPVSMVTTTIRDIDNTIIGYLGVATDLSAKKKAEQELTVERARLIAFVEHAPAAVAMLDKDIKYLAVSRRWLEEYRLTGQDIIGKSHYEIFPSISDEWKRTHQLCLEGEVFSKDEEKWRPPGFDHDQFLKWEVRPWYHFDKSVGGIMMFTQDITETALAREELKHAKLQSEQASIAKSEFLANMSHEIRTPLNGVIGFTDLVLKTKLNDTQKQYLAIVNQSANALLGIINDILDFSKIEAGKLELDIDKCDIYEMVAQSADIISFPIQNKGLEMLLNIPADLPRFIWADEIRLKQVLINLLSNAAKFTEKGEIELKIEILEYDREDGDKITCRFIVRDTGIGIREDKQVKIFEAFLQEDGSTTKKYGGTGLGLTISNKLLGMMGSQLQLSSDPGNGSTFYFDLTFRSETGEPIKWENVDSIRRVLIVDDNENNRMILQQMLRLLKIDSDQARDGFEALDAMAAGTKYDAILMDFHMPQMDGLETIRAIRETFSNDPDQLPIVLLNSSADDALVLKGCEELKVNYRLMKPIKLSDISHCLSRLSQKESSEETYFSEDTKAISTGGMLVIIAEDNPINMFLAKTIISKIVPNAEILEAENGAKAVEFCTLRIPDIVFMDVQMPEMNGYEATMAIRSLPGIPHFPIIALTAGNVKGERDKCIEAGMDDFIAKPFVEETIWQVLNKYPALSDRYATESVAQEFDESGIAHFDLNKLRDMYLNDQEFISEFLTLIREALNKNLSDLKAFYRSNDLNGIKATGHKLKGAASSAFLSEVTSISRQLEHLEHFENLHIEQLINGLEVEIGLLLPVLAEAENG